MEMTETKAATKPKRVFYIDMTVEFLAIHDTESNYEATGYVVIGWVDASLEAKAAEGGLKWDDVSGACPILPGFHLLNNGIKIDEPEDGDIEVSYDKDKKMVVVKMYYNALIGVIMMLHRFPFDRQVFCFDMGNNLEDPLDAEFRVFGEENQVCFMGNLTDMWTLVEPPDVSTYLYLGAQQPRMSMRLQRKSSYYTSNIVTPLFFIVTLLFSSFAFDVTDLGARLGIILTLLLTTAAFSYIVTGFLPRKSYLTLLHYYVLLGFFLLFFAAVESTVLRLIVYYNKGAHAAATAFDVYYALVTGVFWLLLHALIYTGAKTGVFYANWNKIQHAVFSDESINFTPASAYKPGDPLIVKSLV